MTLRDILTAAAILLAFGLVMWWLGPDYVIMPH